MCRRMSGSYTCPRCGGLGTNFSGDECDKCDGDGYLTDGYLKKPYLRDLVMSRMKIKKSSGRREGTMLDNSLHIQYPMDMASVWAEGENRLVTFGRNRSGQDSGELDFSIASYRVNSLSDKDKKELVRLMRDAANRIESDTRPGEKGE